MTSFVPDAEERSALKQRLLDDDGKLRAGTKVLYADDKAVLIGLDGIEVAMWADGRCLVTITDTDTKGESK